MDHPQRSSCLLYPPTPISQFSDIGVKGPGISAKSEAEAKGHYKSTLHSGSQFRYPVTPAVLMGTQTLSSLKGPPQSVRILLLD